MPVFDDDGVPVRDDEGVPVREGDDVCVDVGVGSATGTTATERK